MTLAIKLKNEIVRFAECVALEFNLEKNLVYGLYPERNGEFDCYNLSDIDMISVDFQLVYQNGEFSPKWRQE